jgi:two-component system chemotaxis response regulator CheB
MIRVMLVDDSPLVLHILQRLLSRSPEIQVVGTAADGKEALGLLPALNPDVICTDLHMPVMGGLELTREVMDKYPRPILAVSVSVEEGSPNVFKLLDAGAIDVFPKPRGFLDAAFDGVADELASKIRILAGVRVFRKINETKSPFPAVPVIISARPQSPPRIVVIGASTGGPQALQEILSHLPAALALPLVCVQHIGDSFLPGMMAWLSESCLLKVRDARQGEYPLPGTAYFACGNSHLEFGANGRFMLSGSVPVDGHLPSVTVTMRAAARVFGNGTVGVLLTGMGRDGADGMASIAKAGGITIAQDEASSIVYGMPKEALALGAVQHILSLKQIAPALESLATNSPIKETIGNGSSNHGT